MDRLTQALKLYVGRGTSTWPTSNSGAVLMAFGPDQGAKLNAQIDTLFCEIDALKPDWQEHSLQSATRWVEAEMARMHPGLEVEAIACLGWAFSFSNK